MMAHPRFAIPRIRHVVMIMPCLLSAVLIVQELAAASPGTDEVPDFSFDSPDIAVPVDVWEQPHAYDADVTDWRKRLWYAWIEYTPKQGDRVWIGSREGDEWLSRECIIPRFGQYARPTLTPDTTGSLWLTYETRSGDQWDIMAMAIGDDETSRSGAVRVSPQDMADLKHAAAPGMSGGIWVAWQTDRGGQFDVVARQVTDRGLGPLRRIGQQPHGDWSPRIATDGRGTYYVVWDHFDGNSFNVHLHRFTRDGPGTTQVVAAGDAFEARADIAVDDQSRVWLAWEEGATRWGRPFRGINTEKVREHTGTLHRFRVIRIAVIEGDSAPRTLDEALPMPSVAAARARDPAEAGRVGAFYERARLAVDGAGRPWIAYRHYYTPWLGVAHRSHVEEGWGVYARYLHDAGWSKLLQMEVGQGDGMQRLEMTRKNDGVATVWTTGRTHRQPNRRPRGVVSTSLAGRGQAPPTPQRRHEPPSSQNTPAPPARFDAEPEQVGGRKYRLFFGDLHRHTDLSLCRVPLDGTIDDAYRYAIDVARLDFLGITDHSRDLALGDALSHLWWRCRKEVHRHELDANFFPFFAYERSHSHTADHNVISLRPDMLRPHTYSVFEFWKELDNATITIPHQPIRRDTWKQHNDDRRPLVEIFQGCRDTSIEEDVHRGLDKGYRLGFIASSDHMSTSASYACAWAEHASRESIFEALRARRTFAATTPMRLVVRVGDHWMGQIVPRSNQREISLDVRGTAPIRRVHLVVDGIIQETISPNRPHVQLTRRVNDHNARYAYFYIAQADGHEAWSSPLWFEGGAHEHEEEEHKNHNPKRKRGKQD